MRKTLMCALVLAMLAAPAYADFAALGRSTQHGGIIYDVSSAYYFGQYGTALTELSIAALPTEGYGKTGLTADGNTRLILRYQASSAGSVTFSLSQNITGAALEPLTARQALTSPVRTTQLGTVHQASAVLTAPETWPSGMTYPRDSFTVTATFTPDEGEAVREELTLTLHAPSVVLIHGVFCNNARTFGYDDADGNSGVWRKLENAGLNVISWNYDATKGTSAIINGSNNPLARTLTDAFDALNAQGIASTRADIVAHSMGGLVARQFLRNDIDTGNKSDLSYKQGMIRRVVTIGAPNTGSPIASYLTGKFESISSAWQTWQAKNLWENLQVLLKYFAFQKYKAEDAMAEMANNSDFIAQLGYPAVPFHSIYGYAFLIIRRTNTYLLKNAIINLFGNIAVFIPYGFFIPRLFGRYRAFGRFVLLTLAVLLSVETLQLITLRGSFDVDDIILNLLGGALGWLAARLIKA